MLQPAIRIPGDSSLSFIWLIPDDWEPERTEFTLFMMPTDEAPWFWVESLTVDGDDVMGEGRLSGGIFTKLGGGAKVQRGKGEIRLTLTNATPDEHKIAVVLL